jgi:hypothetical protein
MDQRESWTACDILQQQDLLHELRYLRFWIHVDKIIHEKRRGIVATRSETSIIIQTLEDFLPALPVFYQACVLPPPRITIWIALVGDSFGVMTWAIAEYLKSFH